jgi:hypothetical protein
VNTEYSDRTKRLLRVSGIVQPRIDCIGLGMAGQVEDFDDPLPNRFAVENLFDRHTFMMRGFYSMETVNCVP